MSVTFSDLLNDFSLGHYKNLLLDGPFYANITCNLFEDNLWDPPGDEIRG